MADYARTLAAVDEALATNGLSRFLSRADQLSEDSLSADPFIERLRLQTREPIVDQSGGDLLAITTPVGDHWRRPKEWPKNGRDVTADSAAACAGASKPGVGHRGRWRSEPPERAPVDDLSTAARFDGGTSLAILAPLALATRRRHIRRGGK